MHLHQMAVKQKHNEQKQVDTYISITLVTVQQYKGEKKNYGALNSEPFSETQKSHIPVCW